MDDFVDPQESLGEILLASSAFIYSWNKTNKAFKKKKKKTVVELWCQ